MMVIPKWNTSAAKALLKTKHLPARLEVVPLPTAVSRAFFRSLLRLTTPDGERLCHGYSCLLEKTQHAASLLGEFSGLAAERSGLWIRSRDKSWECGISRWARADCRRAIRIPSLLMECRDSSRNHPLPGSSR